MAVLAMFPLGSVLLPGELLPLQVFEPRYRSMVAELLAEDGEHRQFGVTLIERGQEVGGGDHRSGVGTLARVVQLRALDDGRYLVLAVGAIRLRVSAWLPDDPYPIADVEPWPDADSDHPDLAGTVAAVLERVRATHRLAAEVGDPVPEGEPAIADDPVLASYNLVSLAPLGPADRQRLLAAPTPIERLHLLDRVLDDVDAMLRFRRT